MIPNDFDLHKFLISMVALIICITIHEFAHAFSAWKAGDETPRKLGRISLNPLDHLDPMGTIMMVMSSLSRFGFGWGKPVQVNPYNFRHPRWDNLRVSLWGPLSNLITAAVVGIILRSTASQMSDNVFLFFGSIVMISVSLALFNLIPIAPLDGSHILSSLLPYEQARQYDMFMGRYGFMVLLGLIFLIPEALSTIIGPPMGLLLDFTLGKELFIRLMLLRI